VRVLAGAEADLDGERGPGGAVAGVDRLRDPGVEVLLGTAVGGGQLGLAGRAGVVLGDGVGGAEDGDVAAQLPVLVGQQQSSPGGGGRDRVGLRGLADLTDRRRDLGGACGEVGPPVRVVGEALRKLGEPGQRAGGVAAGVAAGSRRQSRTAATSAAVSISRAAQRGGERGDRVLPVGGEQGEVAAEGGPGGAVGDAGDDLVDGVLEVLGPAGAVDVDGGVAEAVAVPGVGGGQVGVWVGKLLAGGGGGDLGFVAAQDLLEDVDGRSGGGWRRG